MGFFSPWYLLGAAAVALPLWLHLLRRFKRTPEPFSSLMFFERREQSSVKHRRLRYFLLLSLRLALLLLLALAFANPFLNRRSTTAGRRTLHLIALDRSFSMHAAGRMEQTRQEAKRLVASLPPQSLVQIAAVDAHLENVTTPSTAGDNTRAAIDSIQPSDSASSFGEFARALRASEQTSHMHLDVHFVGDMQQTSMPVDFHNLALGPNVSLQLHKVGAGENPNWTVEHVDAPAMVDGSTPVRIVATVAGWNTPERTQTVTLQMDGKPIASKTLLIPANRQATIEFTGIQVPYGSHRAQIHLAANDVLPEDDEFPFAIERQDPKKVLFLYTRSRNAGSGLFYRTALESGSRQSLSVQMVPLDQASGVDFSRYAFVVLSDAGQLSSTLSDALCSFVQRGGNVLIAIGSNTVASGVIPLSKEQVTGQRGSQGSGYIDQGHPAVGALGQFANVQFTNTASFSPKPDARMIARFADGSPLLVEEHAGEGRKLIFASALDNSTNDFALHASFVPFVVQTARYLAGLEENPSSVDVGTPVSLRHRSDTGTADVVGPNGRHELELSQAAKASSFDLSRSGFYEVTRADGRRLLFAAHPDRRESDLRAVSQQTLDLWRNTGDTGPESETPKSQTRTSAWGLWRFVLVFALLAALVESIVASRYLADRQ